MNFDVKTPTPRSDSEEYHSVRIKDGQLDMCQSVPYSFARKLERELSQPNLPVCRNCGAEYEESSTKDQGKYDCPLCGHENYWKRISRYVMI